MLTKLDPKLEADLPTEIKLFRSFYFEKKEVKEENGKLESEGIFQN